MNCAKQWIIGLQWASRIRSKDKKPEHFVKGSEKCDILGRNEEDVKNLDYHGCPSLQELVDPKADKKNRGFARVAPFLIQKSYRWAERKAK